MYRFILLSVLSLVSSSLFAMDWHNAPESNNVIDLRPVPVQCANPRNCAAGDIGTCEWGQQQHNTGLCRSDRNSCFITKNHCGNDQARGQCHDKCEADFEACKVEAPKHVRCQGGTSEQCQRIANEVAGEYCGQVGERCLKTCAPL